MNFPHAWRHAFRATFAAFVIAVAPATPVNANAAEGEADLAVPVDDAAAVELGKARYNAKCGGFCHGSLGKGARAPCIVCGTYKRGGTNAELVRNITQGIAGTPMGAFGEVYSRDEIIALVAFLRSEQKKREAGNQ